ADPCPHRHRSDRRPGRRTAQRARLARRGRGDRGPHRGADRAGRHPTGRARRRRRAGRAAAQPGRRRDLPGSLMRTVSGPTDHVLVVGAGLAGLAAALHLRGQGREVTVLERDTAPGGRMGVLDGPGYRMDSGATVLTMPELVTEALAAVGL